MRHMIRDITVWFLGLCLLATHVTGASIQAPITAIQSRVDAAHKSWKQQEGAELRPILVYKGSTPTLVLTVFKNASQEEVLRNNLAIVTALEFILADDAHDQVSISIVEYNPRRFAERTVRDYTFRRAQFQTAALGAAKTSTTKSAINKARSDRTTLAQLCALLGIN